MRLHQAFFAAILLLLVYPAALFSQAPPPQEVPPPTKTDPNLAPAQALPAIPDSLDEMLAVALRSNPEILQAEAKVQQAEARLNQARLKAAQEVATAFHERMKQRDLLAAQEEQLAAVKSRVETGTSPQLELHQALAQNSESRAQVAQGEAQLRYLIGLGGSLTLRDGRAALRTPRAEAPRQPEIPEKMRNLLEKRVSLTLGAMSLREVCSVLKDAFGKQSLIVDEMSLGPSGHVIPGTSSLLELKEVPLRTALFAIADLHQVVFVFRDYGVLVTNRVHSSTLQSATIPPRLPQEQ